MTKDEPRAQAACSFTRPRVHSHPPLRLQKQRSSPFIFNSAPKLDSSEPFWLDDLLCLSSICSRSFFFFLIATVAILAHFPSTYVDLLFTLVSLYKQGCETGTWIILWPRCLPTVSTASLWLSLFPSEVWSANEGDKKEEQQQSRTGEIKISRYSNTTLWRLQTQTPCVLRARVHLR